MTDRKRLTEFLGEKKPHHWDSVRDEVCVLCGIRQTAKTHAEHCHISRPFTTPADAHALVLKLEEKGMWEGFVIHMFYKYFKGNILSLNDQLTRFIYWLISDPARFCKMVGEYLKEKDR